MGTQGGGQGKPCAVSVVNKHKQDQGRSDFDQISGCAAEMSIEATNHDEVYTVVAWGP